MKRFGIIIGLCLLKCVHSVPSGLHCPKIEYTKIKSSSFTGRWYLVAGTDDLSVKSKCTTVIFSDDLENQKYINIKYELGNTTTHRNGTVNLQKGGFFEGEMRVIYSDINIQKYSVLDVKALRYAMIFACKDDLSDPNLFQDPSQHSNYKIWKISRTLNLNGEENDQMSKVLTKYGLEDSKFMMYDNSGPACKTLSSPPTDPNGVVEIGLALAAVISFIHKPDSVMPFSEPVYHRNQGNPRRMWSKRS